MSRLAGKTALVTEAARGLGRAAALALAREGAQVVVQDGGGAAVRDVAAEIARSGGRAMAIAIDLCRPDAAQDLARQVRRIVGHRLDILVAHAPADGDTPIDHVTVSDFDRLVAANVRAPLFLVQHLLPLLCVGSSVVLMPAPAPRSATDARCARAASHGALLALARGLAAVLGARGARINGIASDDAALEALDGVTALTTLLACADTRWLTGTVIRAGMPGARAR